MSDSQNVLNNIRRLKVIIPVHNEADNINGLVEGIFSCHQTLNLQVSVLLVDDGSTDTTAKIIKTMSAQDHRVDYISFSRNFGKEAAIMAGIQECGNDFDAIAYMDGDGQHTPAELCRLVIAADDPEIDLVCGVRADRGYQTAKQKLMANLFYSIFRLISNAQIDEGVGDFNVMKPGVVKSIREMRETHPFMKGIIGWIGFSKKLVSIEIKPRAGGQAKSSTYKMLRLALGAILSFSSWPLRAWSIMGCMCAALSVLYLIYTVINTCIYGIRVPGYATIVVLLLGLGGIQLFSVGILGEYIARIYEASKNRPRYIIANKSLQD